MELGSNSTERDAVRRFENMLKSNEVIFFDSEEFESIIEFYLEAGKVKKARRAISLGISQHPFSLQIQLLKAETLIFDQKFDEATEVLDTLYELDPANPEIYVQKANIFSQTDHHNRAIDLLFQALELSDDAADVHSLIGMEYLYLDDFKNARKHFLICLELDEEDYSALYNVIYCYDFLGERAEAIEFLNGYIDKHPYSEVAWHQLGKEFLQLKQYEKALGAFEFAIISDEHFIGAYLEMGKVLEKLKRYNEAINTYSLAQELGEPTAFAYLRIGKCFKKLGCHEQSLEYFKKSVEEDPLLDRGWMALTDYYIDRLDFQNALVQIEKATDIDSENSQYWSRYAKIYKSLNLFEEAEYGYKRSLELGNYELETWINRCDMLLKLGEYRAAIDHLKQALDFYPSDPELEFRLAGLFYTTGEKVKGKFHLQNGMRTDAEFIIILEELFPLVYKDPEVILTVSKHTV